jgi:hypothetical protein
MERREKIATQESRRKNERISRLKRRESAPRKNPEEERKREKVHLVGKRIKNVEERSRESKDKAASR